MKQDPRPYDYLKRHVPTNLALLCGVASGMMLVLLATDLLNAEMRSNPLHWLLMAPLLIWGWAMISFDPWAIRLIVPIIVGVPIVALGVAIFNGAHGGDRMAIWILAFLSLVFAVFSGIALSRSPLWPLARR